MICSPAHRTLRKRRQKAQNASSTSSSSSDDERFERRMNKSMVKARSRCLPMNFAPDDLSQTVIKDRMKIGSSLADVDPMSIDRQVTFDKVGGLETYIHSLKEMVLFPLLYPEVFQRFAIQPPRGVLFYGPPGKFAIDFFKRSFLWLIHYFVCWQALEKRSWPELWLMSAARRIAGLRFSCAREPTA